MSQEPLSKSYECPLCRGNHGSQDFPTLAAPPPSVETGAEQ